ncbi:metallophosphoesterase [Chryseosolibacter indicus]|uniref:Metallophosphoesterase n=1 Tax=Chryseosolibacter indicus TaxID=2782351 RepID=A0ABS5VSF9_9BACT|nr:metallophosphoesterase [Chryseosolibacter indicus]MBT1704370.1 metallophosphoesterase [Chryseosolibacter indicus]
MATFVLGDIHGAYRALRQCLERASFSYEDDTLIFLGDVADGWPETKQCIDELLKIKNLVYVFGNHDFWTLEWMQTAEGEDIWVEQGGRATIESYKDGIPESHIKLLNNSHLYYEKDNKLFVHAGFNPNIPIDVQPQQTLLWDRNLARTAIDLYEKGIHGKFSSYEEVYIGHTPITYNHPIKSSEVWMMDTGAGWAGVLSMMNIDTKEVFISDPVPGLYPGIEGRKRRV